MRNNFKALVAGLAFWLAFPASAEVFVINSLEALPDLVIDGVCDAGGGRCTLEAAIMESEATPDVRDTIDATQISGVTSFSNPTGNTGVNWFAYHPFDYIGTPEFIVDGSAFERGIALIVFADNVTISGLHLRKANCSNLKFSGNNIVVEDSIFASGGGLQVSGENAVLRGNRIFGSFTDGGCSVSGSILVTGLATGAIVENNVIGLDLNGQPASGLATTAINILETEGARVLSNKIVPGFQTTSPIRATRASGGLVSDNVVTFDRNDYDFAVNGILIAASQDMVVADNRVTGMPLAPRSAPIAAAILIANSERVTVSGAEISNNAFAGIRVENSTNTIISNSRLDGNAIGIVANNIASFIDVPTSLFLYGNSIANSSGLGIDLGEAGVQPNGPDAFTDYPEIGSAGAGLQLLVAGTQTGLPNELITVEFFESATCDESGYGEGERFLGSTDIVLDDTGSLSFSTEIDVIATPGAVLTATATGELGTSEFSECVVLEDVRPPVVDVEFVRLNAWVLNPRSRKRLIGYFPATDQQDPAEIDIESLALGEARVIRSKFVDIDHDGDRDLLVFFKARDTGATCDTTELTLSGAAGGVPFSIVETVRIRGCWNHPRPSCDIDREQIKSALQWLRNASRND